MNSKTLKRARKLLAQDGGNARAKLPPEVLSDIGKKANAAPRKGREKCAVGYCDEKPWSTRARYCLIHRP